MTTNWAFAGTIIQEAEIPQHARWRGEDTGFSGIKSDLYGAINTETDLYYIANPTVNNRRTKTYYLHLTNFALTNVPDVISGVEVIIAMNRRGRITDETIQLRFDNEFIGDNRADFKLDQTKIFGNETDTWNCDLTKEMVSDSSFGVGLRFQSHPSWPHKDSPLINYVKLRVW
jgi:hypothetical protein